MKTCCCSMWLRVREVKISKYVITLGSLVLYFLLNFCFVCYMKGLLQSPFPTITRTVGGGSIWNLLRLDQFNFVTISSRICFQNFGLFKKKKKALMNSHDDSGLESIPKGNDFFIQLMGLMVHSGRINILILQIQRSKGPYRTETGHFDQSPLGASLLYRRQTKVGWTICCLRRPWVPLKIPHKNYF